VVGESRLVKMGFQMSHERGFGRAAAFPEGAEALKGFGRSVRQVHLRFWPVSFGRGAKVGSGPTGCPIFAEIASFTRDDRSVPRDDYADPRDDRYDPHDDCFDLRNDCPDPGDDRSVPLDDCSDACGDCSDLRGDKIL
jgi:hypothetical protein